MAFIARSPEVFSNARVKIYPYAAPVFQAANAPIFRAAGWEQERAYDVPPKGEGTDPERAAECSRARKGGCEGHCALQPLHALLYMDA